MTHAYDVLAPEGSIYNDNFDRQRQSEKMIKFLSLAKNVDALKGKDFFEVFATEQGKRDFIEQLTPEEFIDLLNGINGILRDRSKEEWNMDGENVQLTSFFGFGEYTPPRHRDKPALFEKTLLVAQDMNKEGRSLEDVAFLFAAAINAIHAYNDGNGRTSRFVYSALTEETSENTKKILKEVLDEYGRDELDINPGLISYDVERILINEFESKYHLNLTIDGSVNFATYFFIGEHYGNIEFNSNISEEAKEFFNHLCKSENNLAWCSMYKCLTETHRLDQFILSEEDCPVNPVIVDKINLEKFGQIATMQDIKLFFHKFMEFKKRYVETLLDVIAHPDKDAYLIEDNSDDSHDQQPDASTDRRNIVKEPILKIWKRYIKEEYERLHKK